MTGKEMIEFADVFFNGRRKVGEAKRSAGEKTQAPVTLEYLISRGVSLWEVNGKVYRVTVEEQQFVKVEPKEG